MRKGRENGEDIDGEDDEVGPTTSEGDGDETQEHESDGAEEDVGEEEDAGQRQHLRGLQRGTPLRVTAANVGDSRAVLCRAGEAWEGVDTSGLPTTDKQLTLQASASDRARVWRDPTDAAQDVKAIMTKCLQVARGSPLVSIAMLDVDAVVPNTAAKKAGGLQPTEATQLLVDILNAVEVAGTWPSCSRAFLGAAIPKASGGNRLIGIAPTLQKVWSKIRTKATGGAKFRMAEDFDETADAFAAGLRRLPLRISDKTKLVLSSDEIGVELERRPAKEGILYQGVRAAGGLGSGSAAGRKRATVRIVKRRAVRGVTGPGIDSRRQLLKEWVALWLAQPALHPGIVKAGGHVAVVGPCERIDGWGLNLSRALGDFHYKARADLPPEAQKVSAFPEVVTMELTPEDEFLLLGCDGVFELQTNQSAVDLVRSSLQSGRAASEAVEDLVDACCSHDLFETQGKGSDNVSALVVLLR
ncbi:unnamed protein product [Prorocentrum cordatum]|uniref:protein-serine/threonine phosphatase n=1 Tax=Prorocentrum cordatum TaxID=2364126 RepID=A0ABN9SE59_9DINO|nr:unnamed protein product [Polarella glacialis]